MKGWVLALGATRTAFIGSLLLSLVAAQQGSLNRDGMLYVETARNFIEGGFAAALATFKWPFLPILMALVAQLTGLGPEHAGYLLNSLFMAGTCALLVSSVARISPEIAWPACLAILAIPGFNEYRHELLREYGCWFFVMLGFWLALRWAENPRWKTALAVQVSLVTAALFRPEAVMFFVALFLWQDWQAPRAERFRRLVMIGALPILGAILLYGLFIGGGVSPDDRLGIELQRFRLATISPFDSKAQALANALAVYAKGNAGAILFFGSLAVVPLKIIGKLGVFLVPLVFFILSGQLRTAMVRFVLFGWGIAAYLLILAVFVIDLQFLSGRYVGLILLFLAPFVGLGMWQMMQRYPRWRALILLLAGLVMVTNVVSLGPTKRQFVEAGNWLARNASDSPRVYVESPRAAYYAGWRFTQRSAPENRSGLATGLKQGHYDLVVLEVSRKEADVAPLLRDLKLTAVARFVHPNGDAVIVARPVSAGSQDKALNTPLMREKTGLVE